MPRLVTVVVVAIVGGVAGMRSSLPSEDVRLHDVVFWAPMASNFVGVAIVAILRVGRLAVGAQGRGLDESDGSITTAAMLGHINIKFNRPSEQPS